MQEKTAKALYALLKELYQSRAAKEFVDEYEHERRPDPKERVKPEVSDVYQDIFGNRYVVVGVVEKAPDGEPVSNPFVALKKMGTTALVTVGLEDFMNPTLKKV